MPPNPAAASIESAQAGATAPGRGAGAHHGTATAAPPHQAAASAPDCGAPRPAASTAGTEGA